MRVTTIGHAGMLVETTGGSILCDPWFGPAFFGSWFVFPRNDRLSGDVQARLRRPTFLYVSHLHSDHFDESWLRANVPTDTQVLLPAYPTKELERRLRTLGFEHFVTTSPGEELDLGHGLRVAIHVETSISDGPGGDSAIVISDGSGRIVNQNDCRPGDLAALAAHGPIDVQFLQFSGAIWYPMVYDEPHEVLREQCAAKVESQFSRALRYVEAVNAAHVAPSAGPPCFLDPELFHLNVIDGDELSIFPDQLAFLERLEASGRHNGIMNVPGTEITIDHGVVEVVHPDGEAAARRPFVEKAAELADYQRDWMPWLETHKASWAAPSSDLLDRLKSWWEPLLAMAPMVRQGVGANVLIRTDGLDVLIDFPAGEVREARRGDEHRYRFDIARELVETVARTHAVDWSNALFLSLRFRAWREGPFNEYVYNFFKSLSVERMRRTEAEARRKLSPQAIDHSETIEMGGYEFERYCPHRQADLSVFGEVVDETLTCTLHGWTFDLRDGSCLNAHDRSLRVVRRHMS